MYNVYVPRLVAIIAALLILLPANSAVAGLQPPIEALWDQLEASNPVRDFVPPLVGADTLPTCVGAACPVDPARWSSVATLIYDWNTGNLSARIPAPVLDYGAPPIGLYAKIYTISDVVIDSRSLPYKEMKLESTIFGWQSSFGPLDTIDLSPSILRSEEQLIWLPNGL